MRIGSSLGCEVRPGTRRAGGLPILLLDEPTEGLDASAAASVCTAIARLRGKRTILFATHREDVARIAIGSYRSGN